MWCATTDSHGKKKHVSVEERKQVHEVPLDCPVGPDFGLHMAKVGIPSGTCSSDTVSGRRLAWLVVQCSGQYSFGIFESGFGLSMPC